jgi:hypothetical protein
MANKAFVRLSTNSWHYKLIKWTLGSNAPTPQNMHNLCPYFWLLVFSILIQPIFAPIKLIGKGLLSFANGLEYIANKYMYQPYANDWYANLSDERAYRLSDDSYYDYDRKYSLPRGFKKLNAEPLIMDS